MPTRTATGCWTGRCASAEGNQRQFVSKIEDRLEKALKDAGIAGKVLGRKKHLYSIYRKMLRKKQLALGNRRRIRLP
jgi:(p)ppGpp synthase/HD superfamily hydrolase